MQNNRLRVLTYFIVCLFLMVWLAPDLTSVQPVYAITFTVNTTADTTDVTPGDGLCADGGGDCSLRAAIQEANAFAGADTIGFNIPGAGTQVITLGSVLPNITQPLIIAGSTQPGYSGTPLIVVNANNLGGNILTVSNTSATLENFRISNATGASVNLINADNSNVNGLDLRWTSNTTRTGTGVYADTNTGPVTIQNIRVSTRDYGIHFATGSDVQLLNNELLDNNQAIYLVGITAGSLPGGINIAGNEYTGSSTGLYFQNMANLIISDGSYPGTNVDVTDGSGNETLTSTGSQALQFSNVDNSRVTAVDLSWTVSTTQFGYGLRAETSIDNLIVDDITSSGRNYGVYVSGGSDVQVLNSDLSRNNSRALQLSNITANTLPRAVIVSGNDYSNSTNGLYLTNLNNQIISDGSVANTNINLTDGSSNHTLTGVTGQALALNNVDNTTIQAVNLSWLGDPAQRGYGVYTEGNSDNLTIQNISAANRQYGVYASGGSDVRVLNSDLANNSNYALYLQTITATTLPGGILVDANTYTNSGNGVYIANQNNLIISDGSVPGTNVDLTNSGGSHTLTTVSGIALEILNSDNLQVDNLNLSWTGSASRSGSGLRIYNNTSTTVLVQNLTVNNRYTGVYIANAVDVRVLNNNLSNNGIDSNNFALFLTNITANTLPGGLQVAGNDFSNSSYGVRLQNLSNLVVSDGSVGGTNVNLTNGGGTHTLSTATAYALSLYNVDNSSVAALNLGWTTTTSRNGTGLYVENLCDNLTLRNLNITNRNQGINANGGTDLRVLNNNLGNNGADTGNFALLLNNIGTTSLPGGVRVDGNDFTDSTQGIRLQNLSNQVISDGSVAGTTITVTNGVGNHTLTTVTGYALYLYNLDNSRIEAVDVSWLGDSTQRGNGIYSESFSDNLTIEDVAAANRQTAIYAYNGMDTRILNSNLANSSNRAIQLQNITANTLPGGVQIAGNTYTNSATGLYLLNLSNITISDGSVAGTNIDVTDGGGSHTLTTVNSYAIYLYNVDNLRVESVNLSWTGNSSRTGYALYLENFSDNVTLQNLTINNRGTGIYANGGSDVRVLNNNLHQNGTNTSQYALYLSAIGATSLPGGVQVAGNDFTDSNYGVRLNNMANLIISDGSVPGTHINLTDGNGNHTLTTVSGIAIHLFNNVDNANLSRLDLSWTGSGSRSGYGLFVESGGNSNDNLTLSNVIVQNRANGLYLGFTTNANINCSTVLNNNEGVWLLSNSTGTLFNNHFQGNSPRALRWDGAASLNAENNYWGAASGPSNLGGTGDTYLGNVDANPFLAAQPACAPLGAFVVTTTADTSDGDTSSVTALLIDPGADEAVSLREAIAAANNTAGSQTINFNIGGGGAQTILLSSALPAITDTVTINGTSQPGFAGTTLLTIDANGLAGVILPVTADNTNLQSLNIANAPGTAISLNGSDGSTLQNVNLSWTGAAAGTGLDVNNSNNVTVTGLTANNRVTGLNAAASNTLTIGCSIFQANTTGLNADASTSALSLAYSLIQGNGNGVNNAAAGVLLAENNYWGAASGPLPLGGTGDNYTGNVDANPFLAVLPDCMTPTTFVVTTINDVSDGDTTSIANLVASPGADGAISLREAIAAANNTAGTDTIGFNIGGGGSHTIVLGSVLPALTGSVILDGSTQPGFSGTPLIIIEGGSLSGSLLTLQGANSTISNLTIRNGTGNALFLNNADNAILNNLNLSWTANSTWTGIGLTVQTGSATVTIQNLTINKRATAISVGGGADVQILNNDLSNSGSTTASLYVTGVTAGTLPGGVVVTGNTFANAAISVRFENMANLVISDGSVGGSNVIFTPGSGLNTATNTPLLLRNVDNSSVTGLNLSWGGMFTSGTGLQADGGCSNLVIQNNTATNRTTGIDISGSSDIQVLNNNLSNNGSWALQLNSITAGSLPGGVSIAGNTYTGSTSGIQLTNMANLIISDGSAPGTNVNLTNGGGVHTLTLVRTGTALYLNNVDNTLITNVNLSWLGSGPARQGTALQMQGGSDTVTMQNITATNRGMGIYVNGGRDVQVLNNNLTDTGTNTGSPALYMSNVTSLSLPGGVVVTGNTFTNSAAAVRFDNMVNLVISDGSIGGSNVIFTAPAGLTTVTGSPLYLNNVDNSSIRNLNLSWSGLYQTGTALQVDNNSANVLIQNNTLSNRTYGLQVNNGIDILVLSNNMSGNSQYAMYLNAITASVLPGGVSINGNDYSNSVSGVYLLNMNNLVISDGSAGGTNINLTDGGGTHTLTTIRGTAINLSNVDNTTVSALNLSWNGGGSWQGTGINIQGNADNVTMQNLTINNRVSGISASSSRDIRVLNNNLNSSGSNNSSPAIYLNSVTATSLPGGVVISGNSFNNSSSAVRFDNMTNLVISDGSVGGSNVIFATADGMDTVFSTPLYLRNVDNSSVSNVDFSWAGALRSGIGLRAENGCNNLLIQNNDLSFRSYGVYIDSSNNTNVDVLNNDLSGASTYGLYMFSVTSGADISGNDFTNDTNGLYLRSMSGLTLGAATGLDTVAGTAITLYDVTNSTINGADVSFSGPIRQGTGVLIQGSSDTGSSNISVQNAVINNRATGVLFDRGTTLSVSCSEVLNNSIGVLAGQPGTGTNAFGVVLNQNWFQGNTIAVNNPDRTNPTPPPPTIPDPQQTNAENNYWGAANGPSNLGGSGDSYSGNVDANPFEIAIPLCVGADYGDLPAAYNLTTQADNGARHQLGTLYLGNYLDFEKDGQESADAGRTAVDGDDGLKDDDEDAVAVINPWQEGAAGGAITVAVTGGTGCFSGWIDWDNNASFADAGDQVLNMAEVSAGVNSLSFTVPAGAMPTEGIYDRFARFRVAPDGGIPNDCSDDTALAVTGTVVNGEVEDYYLRFRTAAATGTGPGGVGLTDGSTSLVLWLAATSGTGTTTNGTAVASWLDQSGYGYNATQGTGANQPTYQGNVVNGQPVLRFDNVDDGMSVADALSLADPYSVMTVFNSTAAAAPHRAVQGRDIDWLIGPHSGEIRHYAGGWVSTGVALTPSQFTIGGAINLGTASSFRVNGADHTTNGTFIGAPGRLGLGATGVVADPLGGDLAEVIVYEDALNSARRIIVENYLSAKYNLSVSNDRYDGDTPGNGNFDLNVAGIGLEADGDNDRAHSAGMIVQDNFYLINPGDYLLFGHNVVNNDNTTADLPTGGDWNGVNDVRWLRHWYIDVTDVGANNGTVDIIFDFSEGSMNGSLPPNLPASNYRLLKRTGTTGPFSDITVASGATVVVTGDQVQFLGVNVTQLGSNFTLGSIDGSTSPTAITMQHVNTLVNQSDYLALVIGALILLAATVRFVWQRIS